MESHSALRGNNLVLPGGAAADNFLHRCELQVIENDADYNHHFRAANHRVLDTLLGQSKLKITVGARSCGK